MAKSKKDYLLPALLISVVTLSFIGFGIVTQLSKFTNSNVIPSPTPNETVSYQDNASLPEKFPADFPVYPGSKVISSWTNEGAEDLGMSVIWQTAAPLSEVKEFFNTSLSESGWKMMDQANTDTSLVLTVERGGYQGFMGVTKDNGVTISVTLGSKK